MKTSLVTAFLPLPNYKTKSLEDYLGFAQPLLDLEMNKIIFTTGEIIDLFKQRSNRNTVWVEITNDFILKTKNPIRLPQNRNPDKDTLEYLLLQNTKPKFLKTAIELDPYGSDSFIWVDFGLSHVLHDTAVMQHLTRPHHFEDKVTAAGIWQPPVNVDIENDVCWVFAGGIIGGSTPKLLEFYEECTNQIEKNSESDFITWEVNVWYQVYIKRPDLFKLYPADHNESMILNLPQIVL